MADFNKDGKPDIAAGGVFVLLNRGDGTFSTSFIGSGGGDENSIVAIDLNRDGNLDLVAENQGGSLTTYIGRGDGTFVMSTRPYLLSDQYANEMAVGDFNGDGIADIAIAFPGTNQVARHIQGLVHARGGLHGPDPSSLFSLYSGVENVEGVFKQNGSLRVITTPAEPAAISVDGRVRDDWGMWTDLPAGDHIVCSGPVPGMVAPPCQTVTQSAGALSTVTATYAPGARRQA